ncbi:GyrI-like domain-containing protein [Gemmobacter sp.]|uniref:AraC family transcriptional regulator n=1 Tax=Gemmobacter sp. TaxID=1898957 RepID=UPI002AFF08A3|nr:GyrI-like domain-containing protein [Gemmobacter sp.]
MYPVTIETLPDRDCAALLHTGPYDRIGETFGRLAATLGQAGLMWKLRGAPLALYLDDPAMVAPEALRAQAAFPIAAGTALPPGLTAVRLAGGRHAVLTHTGPYSGLGAAWGWLYNDWLPRSGERHADRPPFECYPDDPAKVPEDRRRAQICLPLA